MRSHSGLFVDGSMADSVNWLYPRGDNNGTDHPYTIGDNSAGACLNWCLASAYLFSVPLCEHEIVSTHQS